MSIEDDLRTSLRRAARTAEPSPDAWDRLVSARPPGPPRRSRLAAGIVAAAVALGGFVLVVRAFDDTGGIEVAEPSRTGPVLDGTSWVLRAINGEAVTEDRWATLTFRRGEVTSRGMCTTLNGLFELDHALLRVTGGDVTGPPWTCTDGTFVDETLLNTIIGVPTVNIDAATLTLTTDEHIIEFVPDPCSVLSEHDVAVVTGSEVSSSELVPPTQMKVPGAGPLCSYDVPVRFASVGVAIQSKSLQAFEADRDRDPANTDVVGGIGDGAYIHALASISVFDDGRVINIGLQHGAGTDAVPVLEQLARAAVDASPAPSESAVEQPTDDESHMALEGQLRRSAVIEVSEDLLPSSVVVGAGAAWVSPTHGEGPGSLLRIDLATNDIAATVPLDVDPFRGKAGRHGRRGMASVGRHGPAHRPRDERSGRDDRGS
jgi:hypothetical protein